MALQDVCNFKKTTAYSEQNSSALLSTSVRDTGLNLGNWTGCSFGLSDVSLGKLNSGIPLEFYVPASDYLTQSPIQFGQIVPSTFQSHPALTQSPSHLSPSHLPASLPISSKTSVPLPFPMSHGTTTLAFAFQGGAIAAADTRSSCAGLVACPASPKVLPVHSHLVGTTSGTSADCALWKRILARECRLYQLRNQRRLTVGGTAKLLSHMLHPFKGTELCVAATLCGWDGEEDEDEGQAELEMTRSKGDSGATTFGQTKMDDSISAGESATEEISVKHGGKGRDTECEKEKIDAGEIERKEALSGDEKAGVIKASETKKQSSVRNIESQPRTLALTGACQQESDQDTTSSLSCRNKSSATAKAGPLGWTPGPRLCYVCSDGTFLKGEVFSVGSGSPYAYSVLDVGLRWGLSVSEACLLAREAVFRATHRDAYSGNCVDLFHITSRGWRRREREDLKEEYYREKERLNEMMEERRRNREKQQYGKSERDG